MKTLLGLAIANTILLSSSAIGDGDDLMLELSYPSADKIPEGFGSLYKEVEGSMVLSSVRGMKTQSDIDALKGALTKERNDHSAVKATLAKLGDRSVDDVLTILDKVPAWEALEAGSSQENIDNLVNGKLSQHTAPLQRQIEELTGDRDGYKSKYEALQTEVTNGKISAGLRDFATAAKVLPEAVADVAAMGLGIFELADDGITLIAKDGIPGVTPGTQPDVWLSELKEKRGFYWPASQGAGGQGGGGGQGGVDNPWKTGNLTEQGNMVRTDIEKARRLCKAAGKEPSF